MIDFDLNPSKMNIPRTIAPSDFEVVAIRCTSKDSIGKRKLFPGQLYWLSENQVSGNLSPEKEERKSGKPQGAFKRLVEEFVMASPNGRDDYGGYTHPSIHISAIVGKNGSGKSSLIEFMMRLINNLAAALQGEHYVLPAAARLHFIDDLFGELFYKSEGQLFRLKVDNQKVSLAKISPDADIEKSIPDDKVESLFTFPESGVGNIRGTLKKSHSDEEIKKVLSEFFYTVILNHSLYAYNTRDFAEESDNVDKIKYLFHDYPEEEVDEENLNWLHGLFHKNDGYRTPLVITPTRTRGNININRENNLAHERLILLLISNPDLRTINGHLKAEFVWLGKVKGDGYGFEEFKKKLQCPHLSENRYNWLRTNVMDLWSHTLSVNIFENEERPFNQEAIDYLLYKTIKIAVIYNPEKYRIGSFVSDDVIAVLPRLEELIKNQAKDFSHVTRKLFRTLAYLAYDIYPDLIPVKRVDLNFVPFQDIMARKDADTNGRVFKELTNNVSLDMAISSEALLPPPFIKCGIVLHEKDNPDLTISFETLSSGEKQIAYTVSSILYHLANLESVHQAAINKRKLEPQWYKNRVPYRNVLLVMEEVELYFHPELQQQLIKLLLEGIRQLHLHEIRGIHLLFVTHSPYILSDIPRQNVLALNEDGMPSKSQLLTFGANIHDMLRNSFFLSHGARGDLAQWAIGRIIQVLDVYRKKKFEDLEGTTNDFRQPELLAEYDEKPKGGDFRNMSHEMVKYLYPESLLRKWISMLDEPIIRDLLSRECDELFQKSKLERLEEQKRLIELQIEQEQARKKNTFPK